ncbi:MAG: hypothetical protein HC806_07545 [Anaerolineae bacterium]|nr:hypothetical protein [Anaerolineae bacterium]
MEAEERTRLDAVRAQMTDVEVQNIIEQTLDLKHRQETPDPPRSPCHPPLPPAQRPRKRHPQSSQRHPG